MAAANRNRRGRAQLPTCYHEGFLEKKSIKDKMGRKLWTSLCGDSLYFFNSSKDSVYIEKLELSDLISVSDDGSRERNLDAAGFTLHMKKEDVRMIASSLEARELWKGYMLSIAKLSVPMSLNLLPGQIHAMKEIIEKEKIRQRLPSASPPDQNFDPYVCVLPDMPMCFYKVSRVEAEILLDRNPNDGNLLLRPAQDGTSFSLTTRQEVNGSIFKHYRVFRRPEGGFLIDLDSPINCATLHDVVNSMVEKTGGVLVPLHMEKHYDQVLVYLEKNEENGELSTHCAKPDASPTPPVPPPKPVTKAHRSSSEMKMNTATSHVEETMRRMKLHLLHLQFNHVFQDGICRTSIQCLKTQAPVQTVIEKLWFLLAMVKNPSEATVYQTCLKILPSSKSS